MVAYTGCICQGYIYNLYFFFFTDFPPHKAPPKAILSF